MTALLLAYIVFIGVLISPGPDFLIVTRNALGHSARAGMLTALGIAAGLIFHMAYCLGGIALLIANSPVLFNLCKWTGAAYLVYVGIQSLRTPGTTVGNDIRTDNGKSGRQAFMNGLITNLFNPKATMFFLALFSQVIDPSTPFLWQLGFSAACILTAFTWFVIVSLIMGHAPVRAAYTRASKWLDRIFGGFFIALGAKLAFTRLSV